MVRAISKVKLGAEAAPEVESARERILHAAARLYAVHGFDGTSLREVAEAARVTKPLVLYHFASKEKLFATLLREAMDRCRLDVEEALTNPGSATARLRRVLDAQVAQARQAPEVVAFAYEVMTQPGLLPLGFDYRSAGREIFEIYVRLIEDGQRRGEFRRLSARAVAAVPFATIRLYVTGVLAGDLTQIPEDLGETLFDLLMQGVEARRS
jgi:AcrR family transcriptional regulator